MHPSTCAHCPPTCFFCICRQYVHKHLHTLLPRTVEDAVIKELALFFPRCITDSPDLFLANYLPRLLREGVLGPGMGETLLLMHAQLCTSMWRCQDNLAGGLVTPRSVTMVTCFFL